MTGLRLGLYCKALFPIDIWAWSLSQYCGSISPTFPLFERSYLIETWVLHTCHIFLIFPTSKSFDTGMKVMRMLLEREYHWIKKFIRGCLEVACFLATFLEVNRWKIYSSLTFLEISRAEQACFPQGRETGREFQGWQSPAMKETHCDPPCTFLGDFLFLLCLEGPRKVE